MKITVTTTWQYISFLSVGNFNHVYKKIPTAWMEEVVIYAGSQTESSAIYSQLTRLTLPLNNLGGKWTLT